MPCSPRSRGAAVQLSAEAPEARLPADARNLCAAFVHTARGLCRLRLTSRAWEAAARQVGRYGLAARANHAVAAAAGEDHSVVLFREGGPRCFGMDGYGQLRAPGPLCAPRVVSAAAGPEHTVLVRADGSVAAFGRNCSGQCDVPDGYRCSPLPRRRIVAAAAGCRHTVLVRADGAVVTLGCNRYSQLVPPVQYCAGGSLGARFSNLYEEQAYYAVALARSVRAVAAGWNYTVFVFDGRLDDGTSAIVIGANHCVPTLVASSARRCLRFPSCDDGREVVAVAAGSHHTVFVRRDGSARAVGCNGAGQCDLRRSEEAGVSVTVREDFMSDTNTSVQLKKGQTGRILRIDEDGDAQVQFADHSKHQWIREKNFGKLDTDLLKDGRVVAAAAGDEHTVLLMADGTVRAHGSNRFGQCAVPALDRRAVAVAAGSNHTVLILDDGGVRIFGDGSAGQTKLPCAVFDAP